MAEATVRAITPRITLDMDTDEAAALLGAVISDHETSRNEKLKSVRSELTSAVSSAQQITKGVGYVG